jgi:cell wall-associated NlpC family hydrolase
LPKLPQFNCQLWDLKCYVQANQTMTAVGAARTAAIAEMAAATANERARAAAEALKHVGSHDWDKGTMRVYEARLGKELYSMGDFKCNLFVYEMLNRAGAHVDPEARENSLGYLVEYPPLAGQWADPDFVIAGFEVLTVPPDSPQPGDVVAVAHESSDASGHAGIVVGPNTTVSARSDGVVQNNFGFRAEDQGKAVFRRYVGVPAPSGSPEDVGPSRSVAYETMPPEPPKPRDRNRCSSPGGGSRK